MKLIKIVGLIGLLAALLAGNSYADLKDDIVKLVGDNATSYIHPLTNSIGSGMNSGWYNSSKSYKFLMAPIGLQVYVGEPVSVVDDNLRTYDFKGSVKSGNLVAEMGLPAGVATLLPANLNINIPNAPTAVGDKAGKQATFFQVLAANNVDTTNAAIALLPAAVKKQVVFAVPGAISQLADAKYVASIPALGVNLGLPYKVQLGLRLFPSYDVPGIGTISQFGLKAQYEFTQWVPVFAQLPLLHSSIYYAFNNANFFDLLKLNNWTTMVNVSGDFKFLMGLGVYGGIGIQNSTMNLDYTVPNTVIGLGGTKVSLSDKGDNSLVEQIGLRFSIALFDIMADATFGKTTSYFLGVGLGMNGL